MPIVGGHISAKVTQIHIKIFSYKYICLHGQRQRALKTVCQTSNHEALGNKNTLQNRSKFIYTRLCPMKLHFHFCFVRCVLETKTDSTNSITLVSVPQFILSSSTSRFAKH